MQISELVTFRYGKLRSGGWRKTSAVCFTTTTSEGKLTYVPLAAIEDVELQREVRRFIRESDINHGVPLGDSDDDLRIDIDALDSWLGTELDDYDSVIPGSPTTDRSITSEEQLPVYTPRVTPPVQPTFVPAADLLNPPPAYVSRPRSWNVANER